MSHWLFLLFLCFLVCFDSTLALVDHFPSLLRSVPSSPKQEENAEENKPTILIVGAGLAGLGLSLGLSRRGFHVHLIEKRSEFQRRGAALSLSPNSLKALHEISLDDDDMKPSSLVQQLHDLSLETLGHRRLLPWWEIRDCLLRQVEGCKDVTIHLGMDLAEIVETDSDGISLRFRNHPDLLLKGELLVGADGVFSQIREYLNLEPSTFIGTTVWRGNINLLDRDEVNGNLNAEDLSSLLPLLDKGTLPIGMKYHGHCTFSLFNFHPKLQGTLVWSATKKTDLNQSDNNDEDDEMAKEVPSVEDILLPWVKDKDEQDLIQRLFRASPDHALQQSFKMHIHSLPRESDGGWGGRGRITIIGDAAHTMRPVSGHGAGMAFEDCVVLCRLLAAETLNNGNVLKDKETCEDVVLRFENERLPRVRTISDAELAQAAKLYRGEPRREDEEFTKWINEGV